MASRLTALPPGQGREDTEGAPRTPESLEETGIDAEFLSALALKIAFHELQCTTQKVAEEMHLPLGITDQIMQALRREHLISLTAQLSEMNHSYQLLDRGLERVRRLYEVSGYEGVAPVSLDAYSIWMNRQSKADSNITPQWVQDVLSPLVLPERTISALGLSVSSRRSLFLTGPPGNGKTTIAQLLHELNAGEIWIPYAIEVGGQVITIFDPHTHKLVNRDDLPSWIDRRWVRIRRPLVTVGGELTIEAMDLTYSPNLRYYEAPFQLKANGGTLLIDDFGRQRVDPNDLVNRWIVPLEHGVDILTLATGKKVEFPFSQLLIFSTNLNPEKIVDAAFARRLGYRVLVNPPSESEYRKIFDRYAKERGLEVSQEEIDYLLSRYRSENRELRGSEPRDLVERVMDIKSYEPDNTYSIRELLDQAWFNYFGGPAWGVNGGS